MEVVPEFLVVAFKGTKACCRLIDGNKTVGLDRRLLSEPISAVLRLLVSTEASRKGVDAVEILLRYFERTRVRPMFYPSVDETPASQP